MNSGEIENENAASQRMILHFSRVLGSFFHEPRQEVVLTIWSAGRGGITSQTYGTVLWGELQALVNQRRQEPSGSLDSFGAFGHVFTNESVER